MCVCVCVCVCVSVSLSMDQIELFNRILRIIIILPIFEPALHLSFSTCPSPYPQ